MLDQLLSMLRKPRAWILALVVLVCGLHCMKHSGQHNAASVPIIYSGSRLIIPEDSALRSVITTEAIQAHPVISTITLPAVVQMIPSNAVQVFAPLSGQISVLSKKVGDQVQKGDVLYTLVSPDLAQAIADKNTAQAVYVLSEQTVKRQRELIHYKIGPMHDLQMAESAFVQAFAELKRANARLAALHVSESDQNPSGELNVYAPVDGVVAAVNVGLGSYWSDVTNPVMSVMDVSQIYVMAAVQEDDISSVYLGQEVEVLLEGDKQALHAKISVINPVLDPNTRTLSVGVMLDNKDQHLKPNMFARMTFKSKAHDLILLPLTAVIQRGFDSIVYVEAAPWQFVPHIVKVGKQIKDKIEIVSGLTQNQRVALTGGIILND